MNEEIQAHNRKIMLDHVKRITMSYSERTILVIRKAIENDRVSLETGNAQIEAIRSLDND